MHDIRPRLAPAAAVGMMLAACSSTPRHGSEHIKSLPPPPGNVADAVPRTEPRSTHGNPPFYDVNGQRFRVLASADNYVERGVASWYGPDFQGHNTSSGEPYDMYGMTAAHKTLPIPCYARITNLSNGRSVVVRINDRGPFVNNRIVDLSYSAATRLDIVRSGTAFVELRTIGPEAPAAPLTAPIIAAATPAGGQSATAVAATTVVAAPSALPESTAAVELPPPESDPSEPLAQPVPAPVALYIQVGAFADEGNAQRLIQRLQGAGIPQVFSLASANSGRMLRRVRIGPISTVEEFDRLAAQLATLGYPEARLAND
jgi:peptidoglycan lytic transglycosylase